MVLFGLVAVLLVAVAASLHSNSALKEELDLQAAGQAELQAKLAEANARLAEQSERIQQEQEEKSRSADREHQRRTADAKAGASPGESSEEESSGKRMMRSLRDMMDNPQMNKLMTASQRASLEVMYEDLIHELGLNEEEKNYFLDLLMRRQQAQTELGMKIMAGGLSDQEKTELRQNLENSKNEIKQEMEYFLNSAADYQTFDTYEKTMGERMVVSGLGQKMAAAGVPLADGTDRKLVDLMYEVRKNHAFSTNLSDSQNTDMSGARFSKENLDKHFADLEQLNVEILNRARSLLTPEQLAIFEQEQQNTLQMQRAQFEMAAKMFRGGN